MVSRVLKVWTVKAEQRTRPCELFAVGTVSSLLSVQDKHDGAWTSAGGSDLCSVMSAAACRAQNWARKSSHRNVKNTPQQLHYTHTQDEAASLTQTCVTDTHSQCYCTGELHSVVRHGSREISFLCRFLSGSALFVVLLMKNK